MKLVSRLAAVVAMAMVLGALSPATTASAGARCYRYKESERDFARKINTARGIAGVRRLEVDKQLSRVARKHAWEMNSRNSLYHTPSKTLGWRVTRWNHLGENVGAGQTVTSLHQAFMNSPAHRSNILDRDYRHVGIGVATDNNYMWVTVVFEAERDPGTRLRMCG